MSDQWGQQPPQNGYGQQQPYPQNYQGEQPMPTQPMGQYGQQPQPQPQPQQQPYPYAQPYTQLYPQPYPQQQFAPVPPPTGPSKRPMIISGLVALVVIGGAAGIYFATQSGGSGGTVKVASTSGISPTVTAQPTATAAATGTQASPTSAATQPSPLSTAGDSDLLTTNQVCPAFLEIEQPLINAMGGINDEAEGLTVFETYAPKFNALAASTPAGQYQTEIQAVANDLDAILAYTKANPHMSKPAPPAFDTLLDTFQNDADTVDNNCDPLGD